MKRYKIIFFTFLIVQLSVFSQNVTIPDENLKYILTTVNCVDIDGDNNGDVIVDTNNDGEIQVAEAQAVEHLILYTTDNIYAILDLTGLEAFVNLKSFRDSNVDFYELQNNGGTSQYVGVEAIDFTSFEFLERIEFIDEKSSVLSDINVSGLTNLTYLSFFDVRPESTNEDALVPVNLNAEGCISLTEFHMIGSFINLDFCQVPSLEKINAWNVYQNGVTLDLDFNCLTNLSWLDVGLNNLNSLYLKNGSILETFNAYQTFGNVLCLDDNPEEYASIGEAINNFDNVTTTCDAPTGDNVVTGVITIDDAPNGGPCDSSPFFPSMINFDVLENDSSIFNITANHNNDDVYEFLLGQGDFQIVPTVSFSDGLTITPEQFDVSFEINGGLQFDQDLCLEPRIETLDGIDIKFYPFGHSINGPRFDYYVVLKNNNTETFTGELRLAYDEDYSTILDCFGCQETEDLATWNNITIAPNSSQILQLLIAYNSSEVPNFPLYNGDQLEYDLFLTDLGSRDANDDIPDFRLTQTIQGNNQTLGDLNIDKTESKLIVYPNPSSGIVTIEAMDTIKEIEIYNINGQLINTTNQNNSELITLDISKLEKGSYFLSVNTSSGKFTRKIIKN